jgi:hypothetical protein
VPDFLPSLSKKTMSFKDGDRLRNARFALNSAHTAHAVESQTLSFPASVAALLVSVAPLRFQCVPADDRSAGARRIKPSRT